jgi:hypothetical protein
VASTVSVLRLSRCSSRAAAFIWRDLFIAEPLFWEWSDGKAILNISRLLGSRTAAKALPSLALLAPRKTIHIVRVCGGLKLERVAMGKKYRMAEVRFNGAAF